MPQPTYPALFDTVSRNLHSLPGTASFLVGRSETADLTLLDVTCSRQQFRLVCANGRYYVEPLSRTSPTHHNGQPISGRTPLAHEDRLDAGNCRFIFLTRQPAARGQQSLLATATVQGQPARPATPPPPMATVMAASAGLVTPPTEELQPIALSGRMLLGRDEASVQIHLPHPHVSRQHARITLQNDQALLLDLGSANGTFVNGTRIRQPTTLRAGDRIDIGPYALTFTGRALVPRSRSDNVELVARDVRRVVTNRETGKPLVLLDDINLVIRPREFVCLLGPSGSGKSTLLSALSGRTLPDGGSVLVNGQELHAHFDALKQDIAVVPQKDILHESLSVGDALWYTARLRLPPDLSRTEVKDCIDETLGTVGLQERRATLIRHLSGGQVKRASLANEIMCKPSLLFLDEVTSGLDEQTDRDMMDLFRSVADTGKTVVCITHSLANVERTCHLVVILTKGGQLAFVGKPTEALKYFGIQRLGDVYERLDEQPAEHWQKAFKESPLYARYISERLPREAQAPSAPERPPAVKVSERGRLFLRQTALLTRRYLAIWRGDYPALLAMLGQSLLVAVLLGLLFGNLDLGKVTEQIDNAKAQLKEVQARHPGSLSEANRLKTEAGQLQKDVVQFTHDKAELLGRSLSLLFLLAVTSFWFGCNNAAKEIVKERVIYTRERDFNVRVASYYCSKFLLLVFFSALQALILAAIAQFWCHPPGAVAGKALLLVSLSAAGVALGLAISAASPTEEMAITLIPVAVVPQIILSGVIAPLKGTSELLAKTLITAYWGNRGLQALLTEDDAQLIDLKQGSLVSAVLVVLLHALVFVLIALGVLFWQGRGARSLDNLLRRVKGQV